MSRPTRSEALFDGFCSRHGIPCTPIEPSQSTGHRTADRRIWIGETEIVVEITQFKPQGADELDRTLMAGEVVNVPWQRAGVVVERKLARGQLREATRQGFASMLVLRDLTRSQVYAVDFSLLTLEGHIHIEWEPGFESKARGVRGGNRRLREGRGTPSAVAFLFGFGESMQLRVKLNPFAAVQLDPAALAAVGGIQLVE